MYTLRPPYLSHTGFILFALFFVLGIKQSSAQKVYATGTITGGLNGTGILAGFPYGLSRTAGGITTVGSLTSLGIPTSNTSNFYYAGTIKTTAGAPANVGASMILGSAETVPILVQANKGLNALLVPVSGANSFVQFRYTSTITAGTSTYLRLKEKPVRNSTLDVVALGVLGLTSSNVVVGEVYSNALQPQNVSLGTQNQHVGTALGTVSNPTKTDLVLDKNQEWYAIVAPTAPGTYNSVRLTAQFPTDLNLLSLANSVEFNVYNAFTDAGESCNFRPLYTNEGKATGITLDVGAAISSLDLSELVKNPTRAIDDNLDTYASLSSGIASVGLLNSVSQTFFFDHKATSSEELRLQLGLSTSLINLDVLHLNGITVKGYNGGAETPVFTKGLGDLTQLLSINLLNLATINGSSHKKLDLTFTPGVVFDRVEIIFEQGVLGVGLVGDAMRIYDVSMAASLPNITVQPSTANSTNVCEGSAASFTVNTAASAGGSISGYQWQYLDAGNWVNATSGTSGTLNISSVTSAMDNRIYRVKVTGGNASCPQEVISNEVILTVSPLPNITLGTHPTICEGTTIASLPYTATSATPTSYSIIWSTPGLVDVNNVAFPASSPISLSVASSATAGTYNGTITVKNANNCVGTPVNFSIIINTKPAAPAFTISSN